jgi:hypothetical protein
MSSNKKYKKLNEEEKFEKELLQTLRYYGYLFPESSEDVERFEALYGDTEIEMPEHLESIEKIISENKPELNFELSYDMAAFSSNHQNDFEIPDDIDLNDKEEEAD